MELGKRGGPFWFSANTEGVVVIVGCFAYFLGSLGTIIYLLSRTCN